MLGDVELAAWRRRVDLLAVVRQEEVERHRKQHANTASRRVSSSDMQCLRARALNALPRVRTLREACTEREGEGGLCASAACAPIARGQREDNRVAEALQAVAHVVGHWPQGVLHPGGHEGDAEAGAEGHGEDEALAPADAVGAGRQDADACEHAAGVSARDGSLLLRSETLVRQWYVFPFAGAVAEACICP